MTGTFLLNIPRAARRCNAARTTIDASSTLSVPGAALLVRGSDDRQRLAGRAD